MASPSSGFELRARVEEFLFREAELLDDRHFDDWLELFAEEVSYVVPVRRNVNQRCPELAVGGADDTAHFDDDRQSLEWRVARLNSGTDWAEQPPTRTRRLIGNVRVDAQPDGACLVRSNFLLYANRLETQTQLFAGERHDRLIPGGPEGLRIARRLVLLDQSVILAPALSVLF